MRQHFIDGRRRASARCKSSQHVLRLGVLLHTLGAPRMLRLLRHTGCGAGARGARLGLRHTQALEQLWVLDGQLDDLRAQQQQPP